MSFIDCIKGQAKKGFLTKKQAEDLNREYEKLFERYKETMGDVDAAHRAADHFVQVQESIIRKRTENDIRHALALDNFKKDLRAREKKLQAEKDKAKILKGIHGNTYVRAIRDKLESVYERQMSLTRDALIRIADTVEEFRSKSGGFKQDIEGFEKVVREAMGENTGDGASKAHGKALREVFDDLRDQYEAAGGIMGKIENYFPTFHEPELVARETFEEWSSFIMPLLDRNKMIDYDTGLPLDDAKLMEIMRRSYDNIKTNGLVDVEARAADGKQTFGMGGEINMRRSNSRFFHFKNADAFMQYNAKFGRGSEGLFDAMMWHIESLTRDIAIMQKMGTKPTAVMRNLELEMDGKDVYHLQKRSVKGMYDVLSGKNMHGGKLSPMYRFTMGWLNVKRSAYLGSAPISAISDTFFISMASKMNGLPAMRVMGQYMKLLNPANSTDRDVARHLFYVASAANGQGLQGARFADDVGRGGKTAFLASMTNRISGLAAMTDAGRQAPMMIHARMMSQYAQNKVKYADLEPNMREAMARFEIGEKDWNILMRAQTTTHPDMPKESWLMPENVKALDGDDALEAATKYNDWMTALGNTAVNEPRLMTRTITSGAVLAEAPQGSLLRLMFANAFFAKSFPITVMINQLLPSLRSASQGRMGHLAALGVGSAVFGAFAMQVREITKGREPRKMDDADFWMAATLQGGGLGLFGDFMFSDYNRFQQSIGGTMAGPIVGTTQSLLRAGDLYGLAEGDWSAQEFAADVFKVGSREIPGVNLWYSRLLVERMMLDQIEKGLDPKYDNRMRRLERRMQTEQGQGFWWRPGEALPESVTN